MPLSTLPAGWTVNVSARSLHVYNIFPKKSLATSYVALSGTDPACCDQAD